MSHFLRTATNQEIFDAAYMGLKSQGFKKSIDDECVYADGQGRHCAIGWAAALSKSKIPEEGNSVHCFSFWESIGENRNYVSKSRRWFLFDLQCIHDNAETPAAMRSDLEKFAITHKLTVPSFDVPRLTLEPA